MEKIKNIVLVLLFFTITSHGGMFEGQSDLSFLSCSEKRNVTILMNGVQQEERDKFLNVYLKPLLRTPECFIINLFDWEEDRILQLRENTNLNHIQRNFRDDDRYYYKNNPLYERALKFLD